MERDANTGVQILLFRNPSPFPFLSFNNCRAPRISPRRLAAVECCCLLSWSQFRLPRWARCAPMAWCARCTSAVMSRSCREMTAPSPSSSACVSRATMGPNVPCRTAPLPTPPLALSFCPRPLPSQVSCCVAATSYAPCAVAPTSCF